jgi:hypothetical protein
VRRAGNAIAGWFRRAVDVLDAARPAVGPFKKQSPTVVSLADWRMIFESVAGGGGSSRLSLLGRRARMASIHDKSPSQRFRLPVARHAARPAAHPIIELHLNQGNYSYSTFLTGVESGDMGREAACRRERDFESLCFGQLGTGDQNATVPR